MKGCCSVLILRIDHTGVSFEKLSGCVKFPVSDYEVERNHPFFAFEFEVDVRQFQIVVQLLTAFGSRGVDYVGDSVVIPCIWIEILRLTQEKIDIVFTAFHHTDKHR